MLDLTGVRPRLGAEAGSVRYVSLLVDANPLAYFAQ